MRASQRTTLLLLSVLVLLTVDLAVSFVPHHVHSQCAVLHATLYPWEGPLRDEKMQQFKEEETLLKIHCRPKGELSVQDDVLPKLERFVRSFPFAAVLPVQPLHYLPTDDGVEVTFLRKKTKEKGSVDGGMRFFIVQDKEAGDLEIVVKRNSEGQTCGKMFAEKLVVQAFVQSFTGNDDPDKQVTALDAPTKELVEVESVFHKWMDL